MNQRIAQQGMKIGIELDMGEGSLAGRTPTVSDLLEQARIAEEVGLDSIWLADHLLYRFPGRGESAPWEALTMLSALAAVTTRITLGTLVICTSFRPPALLAKMADALDEISGGRFILGLGAGWHQPEYEAFGYPFDHLAGRFEEALQIIVPLLREGHVDFQGKYYQVHNCVLRPRGPSSNGPRILIAGRRPRMLQLTAQYADSWNTAWPTDPAVVKERHEPLAQDCAAIGRDPATLEITVGTHVRLQPLKEGQTPGNEITGSPEEIASRLQAFHSVGTSHLIVDLDQVTNESIRQFGHIAALARQ